MKITKRQLLRIIKEEKAKLNEGAKEMEMELIEDLVDMLIQRGAIRDPGSKGTEHYQEAHDYLLQAVLPYLRDSAATFTGKKGFSFTGKKGF